ncbi:ribosomal protection-like ABC-F family protein [Clostridium frigidicarnis]|uniref:ATPase components of ABC transporters with duplicated ATPase domains n=1 Tax=Clostridium frigidicarnis TaxID=84698 RepID=A0A1I1AUP4_9CLOT|nr:ABC-F type ribosomal protection protein [Clostridium frigidicarnis]SFB41116.1 ATPase components of ABC transporters with duplicated ATPase domains [Clostridium frigidicarnis]
MFELSLIGVKKYMDATLVLKNISFQVYSGEKVGIVGVNGGGKSTILKLIAGVEQMNYYPGYPQTSSYGYDEGFLCLPREATCAYLEQIPQYEDGVKVIDVLKLAFDEVYSIEIKMRELEEKMKFLEDDNLEKALKQYSALVELYEIKGGYNTEEKLSKICMGLKLDESFLNKEFNLLSGGEKTTVVLGKLLIDNPDILLLDEPTNHLDMESIEWLEVYLKSYNGIVIIVSHDRYFLDNVVTKIIEIEDMESETYKGNYSDFARQKEENMLEQFHQYREQQKEIKAIQNTIKELRDWANRVDNNKFFKRSASLQKKLDKMKNSDTESDSSYRTRGQYVRTEKPKFERNSMKLNFKKTERSGNETIKAEGLSKAFEDKVIFKYVDLLINFGERVALIGPNGSGKTTFLKMLLGEEEPDDGVVDLGANVKVAYLPQKITFKNEELTVLECFREDISILEGKAREYLSKFMFYGKSVFKKVKHLSGGEKIRLKLGKLLYEDVNLLILDEPTNHLDIDSIETFEEALEEFKGTVFFISHDRYFINKIGERVIAIEDNGFKSYPGNYDYYKGVKEELKLKAINEDIAKLEKNKKSKNNDESKKSKKVKEPTNIDETKKKEAEKAKVETRVENLEREIQEIDLVMADSKIHYEELSKLYSKKEELSKELDGVMEVWLSLNS